jgi:hypothetical protein
MLGIEDLLKAPTTIAVGLGALESSSSGTASSSCGPSSSSQGVQEMRIVRQKPRDARTVSDLNWEGRKSFVTARDPSKPPPQRVVRDPTDSTQPGAELTTIGPFFSYSHIPENQQIMLRSLRKSFEHPDGSTNETMLRDLADMIDEKHAPIKLYDWFVAQYVKQHRMCRQVVAPDGTGTAVIDIHNAYKSDRWAVRKRHWDFACKRIKVAFRMGSKTYVTAVTQLNAFVFVHKFGITGLLLENLEAVKVHYEKGREESERAAIEAAKCLASDRGLPEDAPLKRKRGRRRKPKAMPNVAPPPEPILLSECSVKTRLSLQDDDLDSN